MTFLRTEDDRTDACDGTKKAGPRRLYRCLLFVAAFLVFCALGLTGLEWSIRVIDPQGISYLPNLLIYQHKGLQTLQNPKLKYEHRPNVDFEAGVRIRTNSLGLRGPEIDREKPPGRKRFLFLGDSVTFGLGVEEKDTFVSILNEALGDSIEVCNGAVVGYNTLQEWEWLKKWGDAVSPDAVLLVYVNNDPDETLVDTVSERTYNEKVKEVLENVSFPKRCILKTKLDLYLVHWLKTLVIRSLRDDPEIASVLTRVTSGARVPKGLKVSMESLQGICEWCRQRSLFFGVFDYNTQRMEDREDSLADRLSNLCREEKIPFFDTQFRLLNGKEGYRNSETDAHPNAPAHRELADRILDGLRGFGLVP